jgi:hypothetical protein
MYLPSPLIVGCVVVAMDNADVTEPTQYNIRPKKLN